MSDRQQERQITREALEARAEALGLQEYSADFAYWLIGLGPTHDWPGRDVVDLDNMGDGPAWLHEALCGDEIELLSDSSTDDWFAGMLSEAYLAESYELGLHCRSDFDSEEDYQGFKEDLICEFRSLIVAWRTAVLKSFEDTNVKCEQI